MHVLVVVAHPHTRSLTRALATEFTHGLKARGHSFDLLDLQAEDFSPVVSAAEYAGWEQEQVPAQVRAYQARLRDAQGLVLVYPIWWASPPASLQGWLQRVLTPGFAFDHVDGRPTGLLDHKVQLIVNIGSRDPSLNPCYVEPMLGVFNYCGMHNVNTLINWGVYVGMPQSVITDALRAAFAAGEAF
jgi:NAD(P)H dehydrogenase (quinone)